MSDESTNPGSCLCGSVTWEFSGEPFRRYNCHCKMCRKAHGAAFGTYWFLEHDQFRWTSETETIERFRSSPLLTRSFCRECGSVVPYPSEQRDFLVTVGGCHDEGIASECEIFVDYKAPWFDITSDLPTHSVYPESTGYQHVEEDPTEPPKEGVVRGSCLCGEIHFEVTEPMTIAQHCHCRRCRHARSAAHASNGFVAIDGVTVLRGEDRIKEYKVLDAQYFTQTFCEICGSKVPRRDPGRNIAVVPLASLDDDPGIRPSRHIFTGNKAGWHEITDDIPQFEGAPT